VSFRANIGFAPELSSILCS